MIKPVGKRFILKPIPYESEIILPYRHFFSYVAEIVATPEGREELKGKIVIYEPTFTRVFEMDGNEYLICEEDALLALFEEKSKVRPLIPRDKII